MSELSQFLITTGRTLSQMSLYKIDHPAVKGAIVESHRLLVNNLAEQSEISLALNDNKLIVNGRVHEDVSETVLRPFVQLLKNFDLHSITFIPGIEEHEMGPFFTLASRGDLKRLNTDVATFLSSQNATHIKINVAKYAKIGEDETVGGKQDGTSLAEDPLIKELQDLSLNEVIKKLVERSILNPSDRERILSRAYDLVKYEIEGAVKKATEELTKENVRITNERERTEEVVGAMADGVVVVDQSGNVLMMNPIAEQMYGVKLGECLGKPLWQGVREEQMVALAKDLSAPSDRPLVKEVQLQAALETKKTLRASTAAVQDTNGRVVGMVSVLSDVTKQKELTRLQNEFMANVTHDLRTPIHALKLAVGAILEGAAGPVSGEQTKMLTLATRNVERLARLIDDLLDFSQLESGNMQINPEVLDVEPLLKESVASLEAWSRTRGIALKCEEAHDLPTVYADSDRILQVIVNLVSNAIKFTPLGGQVTLRGKNVKDKGKAMVQIEVEDTGKGVSPADQKRIFDRFTQLKNQERLDVRGTGLGLSICKALVDLHKGQLSLISPPPNKPGGSLFSFTLPSVQKGSVPVSPTVVPVAPVVPVKPSFWKKIFSRFKVLFFAVALTHSLAQARPYVGTVRRVFEGDVIQLMDGTKVRYLGIDAPKRGSKHFNQAVEANRNLVENKEVHLEYGLQERGLDGIWQAYVYVEGLFINREMVLNGLALVSPLSNEEDILPKLIVAERTAQRNKNGIWEDSVIDSYSIRAQKKSGLPVASENEIKRGIKE